jgi:ABC-type multidrug transport system fused ATPase/permease subunit
VHLCRLPGANTSETDLLYIESRNAVSDQAVGKTKLNQQTLQILRRCLGYLKPYWQLTAGVYLAMVVINSINIATPQFIRYVIDQGIYGNDLKILNWSVAALLGVTVIKGVFVYLQGGWTEVASQNVAYDVRNAIQRKLNRLSFAFHDRMETGQILSRAIQDVERVRFLTGRAFLRIVEGLFLMVGTAGVLIWMNPHLGLLTVLTLPLIIQRAYAFGNRYRPLSVMIQNHLGFLTTRVEQNLHGTQVVKGFAQEDAEIDRFVQQNESWFNLSVKAARLQAVNVPMLDLFANLGTVLILWYGGNLVFQQQLSLGELVAFTTYLAQLVRPMRLLGRIIPALAIAASSGERIFEILDDQNEIEEDPQPLPLVKMDGHVCFENVTFGYENQQVVVKDIDFEAKPGQVIALLGGTGSGKSTIINLVTRFYDPWEGRVLMDGVDARKYALHDLRRQIGIVLQDTRLFAASVRDNIAFGQPGAREEEIIQAARDAQAHDFIEAMPDGYDTMVGERGVTLSGGQKQRIAIARTILIDPRILILDDATSSVDTETEKLIQLALTRLMQGRTTFIIAHRLSTVRQADLILMLEKGKIAARGTHSELLSTSERYAEIYQYQLRPEERMSLKGAK